MDSLCFHGVRSYERMIFRSETTFFLCFGDQGIDHACVFTVNSGKTAAFAKFLEDLVHIAVIYDHCRISHIKFEACDSVVDHILYFCLCLIVPFYDRHMERIIAGAFAVGFFVPFIEAFFEGMAAFVL